MPVYEYKCNACKNKKTFTVAISFKEHERGEVVCPGCGSRQVTQLISQFTAKTESKA
jgi:putative FmdB family regulatory protein